MYVAPLHALNNIQFNSSLRLKVYERGFEGLPDRLIGTTPITENHPLLIAPAIFCYVRPLDSLANADLDQLAALVRQFGISGLDLSGHSELTDESLVHLQALDTLRMLDLSETSVTDKGFTLLHSMKQLTILIAPESMTDRGIGELAGFMHLRELTLDRTQVTDQGIKRLADYRTLERLDISATPVTDRAMRDLARLPHLRQLILNNAISDAGAALLKESRSLEEVDLSQTQMGEQGMKAIAALPRLLTLYANKTFNDLGAGQLSASLSLRTLDLSHSAITDEGVKALSRLKTLQELALSQTHIGNRSVAFLSYLPQLRMLELSDTGVTSAGLNPLAGAPHLEIISLSWVRLTRDDLEGLARLAHLQTIVLNGVPLPASTMARLRRLAFKSLAKPLGAQPPILHPLPDVVPAALTVQRIDLSAPTTGPKLAGKVEAFKNKSVQHKMPTPHPAANFSDVWGDRMQNPAQAAKEKDADPLLKTIADQSNPARGGGFSSLADLKQVSASAQGRLSDIFLDADQNTIAQQEDLPENSLGEIAVGVKHAKKRYPPTLAK